MARCLISFGANIGNPLKTILSAAEQLRSRLCAEIEQLQLSRCFRTPPVGGPSGQPPFINAVAAITTTSSVWEVWHVIREVERLLGRERNQRWEARRIDLDILLYDEQTIWTPHLKVPHPRMCMRRFILVPALDVAAGWKDPVSGWTIDQLAANVRSGAGNFLLLADPESHASGLLAEVARRTGAIWQTSSFPPVAIDPSQRWLSLIERPVASANSDWRTWATEPIAAPKLLIVLAPLTTVDAAWEDVHLPLAQGLNLCPGEMPRLPHGPRYLLATSDSDWAIQEMIAAIEAMDCPVESL